MRDTLDLTVLKQQSQKHSETRRWVSMVMRYGWLAIAVVWIIIFIIPTQAESELAYFLIRGTLLVGIGLVILTLGALVVVAFRSQQHYAHHADRIKLYAPAFVARPSRYAYIQRLLLYGSLVLPMVLIAVSTEQLVPVAAILAGFTIMRLLYRRFLFWVVQGGLARVERFLPLFPRNRYLQDAKAAYLIQSLPQMEAAKKLLYELLSRPDNIDITRVGLRLNNLGYTLSMTGQYDEALPILEAAVRIAPDLGYPFDSLANWYLDQNLDPERALEFTELALQYTNEGLRDAFTIHQAVSARALALTERDTRAEVMIQQALEASPKIMPASAAEVHRQVGYARLAQGNRDAAVEHFQRAATLDPDGLFGTLAQRALNELETESATAE